ncbi:MAG: tail fiber domain-containing protein [Muribaculaceae bacterium]|nr:tail fiber domain-containing protein [Muribaculaceae bacterium]
MKHLTKTWLLSIVAIISLFTTPSVVNAQITYTSGKLSIEGAPAHSFLGLTIDKMNGLYWTCKTGNFFQLDLTPANPRIAGTGNQVVFYNTGTGKFNSIQVASVYNYSDERAKTNIRTLDGGLNTIMGLRPVSYNWKTDKGLSTKNSTNITTSLNAMGPEEEDNTQYGFLAQEVEQIIPDAVKTDENGNKLINYTAIIPMLVQSVQELQGVITQQNSVIENLSTRLNSTRTESVERNDYIISCTPNPTHGETTFTYSISQVATNAKIIISDLMGAQTTSVNCDVTDTSVSINLSSLRSGVYIATLVVDNNVKDSKQIVVAD